MYKKTKQKIHDLLLKGTFSGVSFSFMSDTYSEDYAWGKAQVIPTEERLTTDYLFDVASLTKVICTTTLILQLIETKVVALDQPLKVYYPDFKDEKVTIRHLLTHTADIHTYIPHRDCLSKEELRYAYNQLSSGELLGKEVSYTDTGMILLGFMLETLLNQELVTLFTDRVLFPLKMTESEFLPKKNNKIVPTENHSIRGLIKGETHDPKAFILAEHAGNAGLFTNIRDVKKFVQMFFNRGQVDGKRFLSDEIISLLLIDQTPSGIGGRSLGWDIRRTLDKQPLLFHTGYTGTFLLLDLIEKEAFIFLSNRIHPIDDKENYLIERDELLEIYLAEKDEFMRLQRISGEK